jgi:hypothetical protein
MILILGLVILYVLAKKDRLKEGALSGQHLGAHEGLDSL